MTPDDARYATRTEPIPPDAVDRASATWHAEAAREFGTPTQGTLTLVGGAAAIGAAIGVLPTFGGAPYATVAPIALGGVGLLLSLVVQRRARAVRAGIDARVAALRSGAEVTVHTLALDGAHRFVPHEHGVLVLARLDAARTLAFDVSSVADDPRHEPIAAALAANAVPRRWRWLLTAEGEVLDFTMTGPPLTPVIGEEGWDLDDDGLVQRVIDATPDGGGVAMLDFDALVAREAARRR